MWSYADVKPISIGLKPPYTTRTDGKSFEPWTAARYYPTASLQTDKCSPAGAVGDFACRKGKASEAQRQSVGPGIACTILVFP